MYRKITLVFFAVMGAFGTYRYFADLSANSVSNAFNRKTCGEQAQMKVEEFQLPSNGATSYDPKRKLCVYKYQNSYDIPEQLTWTPKPLNAQP